MAIVYELAVQLWCWGLVSDAAIERLEAAYYRRIVRRGWERAQ